MSDVCKDGFLPDLGNEMSGEQIVFEQKLFRANEAFIWVNQEILSWFQSPVEQRCYLKSCMNNKKGWWKKMKKYAHNRKQVYCTKIIKSCDGIGE